MTAEELAQEIEHILAGVGHEATVADLFVALMRIKGWCSQVRCGHDIGTARATIEEIMKYHPTKLKPRLNG